MINPFDSCKVLKEMFDSGELPDPSGETRKVHSQIPPEDVTLLHNVVLSHKPKISVEVGMAFGASTLSILSAIATQDSEQGLPSLLSIDPNQSTDWYSCGVRAVSDAGLSAYHTLSPEPDYLVLPSMLASESVLNFAFIDGWHTFDHAFLDWWFIDKMLGVGGIVGFDDYYMPSVSKAVAFAGSHRRYEVIAMSNSARTIYLRKTDLWEPSWDYFHPF